MDITGRIPGSSKSYKALLLILPFLLTSAGPADPSPSPVVADPTFRPTRGANALLGIASDDSDRIGAVYCAKFESTFKELDAARDVKDEAGVTELLNSGDLWIADGGTRVLVLDVPGVLANVRIQSGAHAGQKAWVSSRHVITLIPDPLGGRTLDLDYRPAVGDEAILAVPRGPRRSGNPYASTDDADLLACFEAGGPSDDATFVKRGVLTLKPGAPVRVLALGSFKVTDRERGGGALKDAPTARVELLDGPHKGRQVWTMGAFVTRFFAAPPAEPESAKVAKTSAATLLKLGANLERAGKPSAALGYYRRVVKEYPKSPEAATAAARAKVLEPGVTRP